MQQYGGAARHPEQIVGDAWCVCAHEEFETELHICDLLDLCLLLDFFLAGSKKLKL